MNQRPRVFKLNKWLVLHKQERSASEEGGKMTEKKKMNKQGKCSQPAVTHFGSFPVQGRLGQRNTLLVTKCPSQGEGLHQWQMGGVVWGWGNGKRQSADAHQHIPGDKHLCDTLQEHPTKASTFAASLDEAHAPHNSLCWFSLNLPNFCCLSCVDIHKGEDLLAAQMKGLIPFGERRPSNSTKDPVTMLFLLLLRWKGPFRNATLWPQVLFHLWDFYWGCTISQGNRNLFCIVQYKYTQGSIVWQDQMIMIRNRLNLDGLPCKLKQRSSTSLMIAGWTNYREIFPTLSRGSILTHTKIYTLYRLISTKTLLQYNHITHKGIPWDQEGSIRDDGFTGGEALLGCSESSQ